MFKKYSIAFFLICSLIVKSQEKQQYDLRGNGMLFTPNKGQVIDTDKKLRPDILFVGDGGQANVYIRKTGISYVMTNAGDLIGKVNSQLETEEKNRITLPQDKEKRKTELLQQLSMTVQRTDVEFINCNSTTEIITKDQTEGYKNFYYSHLPAGKAGCPDGITHVNSYNTIVQKNIYKNIDVKYYGGKVAGLKYDIVVNPGGNPADIQLKYAGAKSMYIKHNKLYIQTPLGEIEENIPKVYQNIDGEIKDVKTGYSLVTNNSSLTTNDYIVSFKLSNYNPAFPLIIDPWVTYFGGNSYEGATGITTDPLGNVAFTGYVLGPAGSFPITVGAMQNTALNKNAFVAKMDVNGVLLWSTFYGGANMNEGNAIASDALGNFLITGKTEDGLPIGSTGANVVHQNIYGGGFNDAFLLKLDPSGSRLWATYYGGLNYETNFDVTTDGTNVYLYGMTDSPGAISTVGCHQFNLNAASTDVFLVKFSSNGTRLWGTYLGGSGYDQIGGVACDKSGNIFIGGHTTSSDFPAPINAFSSADGYGNVFLFKFNPSGTKIWSTFYGDTGSAFNSDISVDASDNVIMAGNAYSQGTNIATAGASQPLFGGGTFNPDLFVVKFNNAGVRLWGTFLGGSAYEMPPRIATDTKNNIYVGSEWEESDNENFIISSCAYQPSFGGVEDQFITKYDSTGKLLCTTSFGGIAEEDAETNNAAGIAVHGNNLYYALGDDVGGPATTANAYQPANAGGSLDCLIAQLCTNLCEAKVLGLDYSASKTTTCVNDPITFSPAVNNSCDTTGYKFHWVFTGGTPSTSDVKNPIVTYSTSGTYNVKLVLTTTCRKDSLTKNSYITITTPTLTATSSGNIGCGVTTATLTGTSAGNTMLWNGGALTNASNPATVSAIGTYTITSTDINGCTKTATLVVSSITGASISSVSTTSVSCNGQNSGSAQINISGGASNNYTYSWSGGSTITTNTSTNINNLSQGTYTVTVIDGACTTTTTVIIAEPNAIMFNAPNINPSSCGSSNGSVNVLATGGTGSFNYVWSNLLTGPTINNQSQGTYTVTVTDATSCTKTLSVNIGNIGGASFIASAITNATCNTANGGIGGTATVNITGGVSGNYTYSWSNNTSVSTSSTSSQISALTPQIYTITVTDGLCSATTTINITQPPAITFTTINSYTTGCGTNNGGADVTAAGGTPNYIYNWSTNTTGQTINGVGAGTYFVTVTDVMGCTTSTNVLVNNIPSSTIDSIKIVNPTCKNSSDGSAIAYASGGVAPLTYSWSNAINGQTTSNLQATTYIISVTDGAGCLSQSNVVVTEPSAILFQPATTYYSMCRDTNGSAYVLATGGTGTLTYNWSNGNSGQSSVLNLVSATYTVTVNDENNCSNEQSFTVPNAGEPFTITVTPTDPLCSSGTGSAVVLVTGGTGPFTYNWSNGMFATTTSQADTANPIFPSNYTVVVTTDYCPPVAATFTINIPPPIIISPPTIIDATCNLNNGSINVVASGGTGALNYSWSNIISGQTNSNIGVGTYTLTVTDVNNCTTTLAATINNVTTITINPASITNVSCNGQSNGNANISASGGTGVLTYMWSNATSGQTIANVSAATYTISVMDGSGCANTTTVIITEPTILQANTGFVNTTCGYQNGQAFANPTGGNGTYTYLWSTNSTGSQISSLTSQIYSVTITDSKGCTTISTTTINDTPPPIAIATATATNITSGSSTTLNASGGTTYLWTPPNFLNFPNIQNPVATPPTTTTYTVIVTDANNCKDTAQITIDVTELKECTNDPYLPIAFSPNGDGQNDILYLRGNNLNVISLSIYNRWGNKVFETATDKTGWDGTYNGQPTDSGVYVYYLKATCLKDKSQIDVKGNVTLVR